MKKLFAKDTSRRKCVKKSELNVLILKQISSDLTYSKLTCWATRETLSAGFNRESKTRLSNRCVQTVSRKSFNKLFNFSRIVFVRLAKSGQFSGLRKSSW